MQTTKFLVAAAAVLALSGCDAALIFRGGTFEARLDDYTALETSVNALSETSTGSLPAAGGYSGMALIDADSGAGVETFVADASLTANFTAHTVSGLVDNIEGEFTGITTDTIDILDGTIVGSQFSADLVGNLTVGATIYDLDGGMIGSFRGPNADAVSAIGAGDLFDGIPDDGDFTMTLVGER